MSTLNLSLLLSLAVGLSACSQIAPFEDRRREPGTERIYIGASKPGAPAICYNPLLSSEEEVQTIANNLCSDYKRGTFAQKINNDSFSCRLFVPSKAYYRCVASKK